MPAASHASQLAGNYLQHRFACGEVFDHKAPSLSPPANIAHLPFGFQPFSLRGAHTRCSLRFPLNNWYWPRGTQRTW